MKLRKLGIIAAVFVISTMGLMAQSKGKSEVSQPKTTSKSATKVVAYYFHGDFR